MNVANFKKLLIVYCDPSTYPGPAEVLGTINSAEIPMTLTLRVETRYLLLLQEYVLGFSPKVFVEYRQLF